MWTRAPPFTSVLLDCFIVPGLALDQEEEGEACPRLHHNHQPGEQELEYTKPLALDYPFFQTTTIHHDLPEAAGSFKRLPTEDRRGGFISETCKLSHMSTPESTSVARVRQLLLPEAKTSSKLVGCKSLAERRQLDDMQTQIANAYTRASSDQEVPELVVSIWSSPSKRRRLAHNEFKPTDSPDSLSTKAYEDSGVTAEQHMADLGSSKASTPEDIDSAAGRVSASLVVASDQPAAPQCCSTPPGKQVEQKKNVESQILEPRQLDRSHFSGTHPSDDDTQSTSKIRIWVPHSRGNESPTRYHTKAMASGSDEWLQLSLGSRQSDEPPVDEPDEPQSPTHNPPTSTTADPPQAGIRDFFNFGGHSEIEGHHGSTFTRNTSSPYRAQTAASAHSAESPRHQHYSGTPESSHRSGTLPRPLTFLEPRPRPSRDSPWVDPNVHIPRVPSGGNVDRFLSPSPVLQKGYNPQPAFSNLSTLPYHPARVLQPVRSEQTETTSVHAWRTGLQPTEAGASLSASWMQPPGHHDPPRTPPNPAELLSMASPGAFRDWGSGASPSFLSMQPPLAQGVDAEQAWRNLLQRVGNNLYVPSGFGGASSSGQRVGGEAMMLPPGEREEYLDALTRAVERFQEADQGGKDEPLTELQRLQKNAMFPPGQRPHLGPTFDPSTDISLARYYNTPPSSGSKPRAPAPASSSDRQRRILRPHAPRPGLWFTLQASNSQPEASPLQQIPTAYIRVVDDNMTVAAVRRYLVNKLGLASEDEVELTCKGQPLQPSIPLSQVRDGIWQSPNTNTPNPNTPQLLSEGKAWKANDGSITLVGDVVMVLTYGRPPQGPPPTST